MANDKLAAGAVIREVDGGYRVSRRVSRSGYRRYHIVVPKFYDFGVKSGRWMWCLVGTTFPSIEVATAVLAAWDSGRSLKYKEKQYAIKRSSRAGVGMGETELSKLEAASAIIGAFRGVGRIVTCPPEDRAGDSGNSRRTQGKGR